LRTVALSCLNTLLTEKNHRHGLFQGTHENWGSLDTSLSKYTLNSGFKKLVVEFYWKNGFTRVAKAGLRYFILLF